MLKTLTLIGMIFVGNLCGAAPAALAALPVVEDLDIQLRNACTRATNAATFETMAAQSAMAPDDGKRSVFNTDLVVKFNTMGAELGRTPLFSLRTIETKENAESALPYYTSVKNSLSSLMQTLTARMDQETDDVE